MSFFTRYDLELFFIDFNNAAGTSTVLYIEGLYCCCLKAGKDWIWYWNPILNVLLNLLHLGE